MVEPLFEKERYIVTYNPTKGKVYALLKDQAKSDDVLKAAFHGHVLLHSIRISVLNKQASIRNNEEVDALCFLETPMDIAVEVAKSFKIVSATYGLFKDKAAQEDILRRVHEIEDLVGNVKGQKVLDVDEDYEENIKALVKLLFIEIMSATSSLNDSSYTCN